MNTNARIAGRSKLLTLVEEIHRLIAVKHSHLQQVYAVKLGTVASKASFSAFTPVSPWASGQTMQDGRRTALNDGQRIGCMRLCLLLERSPQLILDEVLVQCESFRKDRAIVRCLLR